MWALLARPAAWALGGIAATYILLKRNQSNEERLRATKLESIEQQRTINRLRAELGRNRSQ